MNALVDLISKCINLLEMANRQPYVPNFDMAVLNILQCIITQIRYISCFNAELHIMSIVDTDYVLKDALYSELDTCAD